MENNFLSLIKTRRSVRAYKPQPVPSEALDAVLEAGTYAPTGGGRQSPTIIAITDPKYRQEIARLNAEVMGNNTDPYYGAPVVILVLADGSANLALIHISFDTLLEELFLYVASEKHTVAKLADTSQAHTEVEVISDTCLLYTSD